MHDASGNPHIPNGAHLTARELGEVRPVAAPGRRVEREADRRERSAGGTRQAQQDQSRPRAGPVAEPAGRAGVAPDPQSPHPAPEAGWIYHDGCTDLFAALGAGKCRLYVIPSLNMVALRQGDSKGDRFDDSTFLSLLLTGQSPEIAPRRPSGGVQGVDTLLQRMDRNGDGKIAPDEAGPQLRRWFDRLDEDGDGTLGAPELRPILERRRGKQ